MNGNRGRRKASPEIEALLAQRELARSREQEAKDARRRRGKQVKWTARQLRRCGPEEVLKEWGRTRDIAADQVASWIRERWRPAAGAVGELIGVETFLRIPIPGASLSEVMRRLFGRVVADPDSDDVEGDVVRDLLAILDQFDYEEEGLFYLFDHWADEIERLYPLRINFDFPEWLRDPDQDLLSSLSRGGDPGIIDIRSRLHGERAERVIGVYARLMNDDREWIPRSDLPGLGIAPTTLSRPLSSSKHCRRRGGTIVYRRQSILEYVQKAWRPHGGGRSGSSSTESRAQ